LKKALIGALACAAAMSMTGTALAQTTEVVTESDVVRQTHGTPPMNDWVLYSRDTGTGAFQPGPATPPSGSGSLHLTTTTGNDKVYLFNYDHLGTPLSAINELSYSTYRFAGEGQQVTALNLEVDVNGAAPDGFTTLVFEPVYNTSQGAVGDGVWQDWDAYGSGRWWSTKAIPGVCAFDCFVPWSDIVAENPSAVIAGGFGVNQGGGNPNLSAATDALRIGYGGTSTTFDFEPPPPPMPSTKDDCKKGGWESYGVFKNQGDCVSYVATGGKNS
jgi:hypothetical protein